MCTGFTFSPDHKHHSTVQQGDALQTLFAIGGTRILGSANTTCGIPGAVFDMRLISLLILAAAITAIHTPVYGAEPPSFGSQIILETLWTPAELQGSAKDRKIRHLSVPDRTPPFREQPTLSLPPLPSGWQGRMQVQSCCAS